MEAIKDYNRYTTLMRNGFYDKLFFVDKLFGEWSSFLDYGCADGFLTKLIAEIFPDKNVYGYEASEIYRDNYSIGSLPDNVHFSERVRQTDVILLSSVLHEILHYGKIDEIAKFWYFVFNSGYKYIIIRDMICMENANSWLSVTDALVSKVTKWCSSNGFYGELLRFEEVYGDIAQPKAMLQFLLKYMYISSPNWNRELQEDYLHLNYSSLMKKIPPFYTVDYSEVYTLPYLQHKWAEDFGAVPSFKTHIKMILKFTDND